MSERGMRVKSDPTMLSAEADVKMPTLCEVCLGDNPMVRMVRKPNAKGCNACGRPMTEFRWKAGTKGRFKVNVVCSLCSRSQNVCQCCLHDLTYGVPVAVRNAILKKHGGSVTAVATSSVMQDYTTSQAQAAAASDGTSAVSGLPQAAHAELMRMMAARNRRGPDYSRNLPKFDTMAAKGEGTRGGDNPYRTGPKPSHWIADGKSVHNSIRDRFYGADDAIADRQLTKWTTGGTRQPLEPPADASITTLWLGGVDDSVSETALREALGGHGPIVRVALKPSASCAFVEFGSRAAAEAAAGVTGTLLKVGDRPLRVDWSRKSGDGPPPPAQAAPGAGMPPMPPPPGMPMPPAPGAGTARGNPRVERRQRTKPSATGPAMYPSMDPSTMGARSSLA